MNKRSIPVDFSDQKMLIKKIRQSEHDTTSFPSSPAKTNIIKKFKQSEDETMTFPSKKIKQSENDPTSFPSSPEKTNIIKIKQSEDETMTFPWKTKVKQSENDPTSFQSSPSFPPSSAAVAAVLMDENLLFEILKHVDARTLGAAACVRRRWYRTAQDERLWEQICTRHSANIGCGSEQLRIVVLALGGFRCLHSRYLLPLSKPSVSVATSSSSSTVAAATSSSVWPCLPPPPRTVIPTRPTASKTQTQTQTHWGKDEIQLSLSLLSIRYFEKLNYSNRNNK